MSGAFLKSSSGVLTIWHDGDSLTVAPDHPNYVKIKERVQIGDFSNLENLLNVAKAITEYSFGKVTVRHGQVFYGTHEIKNSLVDRILSAMNAGQDFERFIKFLDKLLDNPSNNAVNQLYDFIKHYDLKISADGDFYTYKAITGQWVDKWTQTISNAVGAKPSMPRSMVCEDPNMCAGPGLHCGSILYASTYGNQYSGDKMIVVKVNPANVVSIPKDSDYQKCRTSGYEVVSESDWYGNPINGEFCFQKVGASTILRPEDRPTMNHGVETAAERVYSEEPSVPYVPNSCEDWDDEEDNAPCRPDCGELESVGHQCDDDDDDYCEGCGSYLNSEGGCDNCEEEEEEEVHLCSECGDEVDEEGTLCDECEDDEEIEAYIHACATQQGDEPENDGKYDEVPVSNGPGCQLDENGDCACPDLVPLPPEPPVKKSWWRNLGW